MTACWEMRGCDEEMQSRCPHNLGGDPCPAECFYAQCARPTHHVCSDILSLLNPDLNYDAAVKEVCRMCDNFLQHGPGMDTYDETKRRQGNPNRFLL